MLFINFRKTKSTILITVILLIAFDWLIISKYFPDIAYATESNIGEKYLKEGKEAYQNGDVENAIESFKLAIKKISNARFLGEAHFALGYCYYVVDKKDKAKEQFLEADKLGYRVDSNTSPVIKDFFDLSIAEKLAIRIKQLQEEAEKLKAKIKEGKYRKKEEKLEAQRKEKKYREEAEKLKAKIKKRKYKEKPEKIGNITYYSSKKPIYKEWWCWGPSVAVVGAAIIYYFLPVQREGGEDSPTGTGTW